jgi:hypothetical protein
MKKSVFWGFAFSTVIANLSICVAASPPSSNPTPEKIEFFEKHVRPILVSHCYTCHSAATKPAGQLRLDERYGLINGGDSGPAIVPGDPANSLILKKVQDQDAKLRMPKDSPPLSESEIADLTAWIQDGAAWPAEKIPSSAQSKGQYYERLRARLWSLQPLANPQVPSVVDASWPSSDIDRFILAKLEEKKLAPVGDADRLTLIRRVTYDLTGLPPTPSEIAVFLKDKKADAYARLVERLLASPAFGERWGRLWLDVARYGESTGPSRNIPYPHAWKYRDYVIDAVNRDVPFNRFLQEQVAGDLLPVSSAEQRDRLLIATGFLALGPKDVNQRFKERFQMDNVDEQIDTVSRSALAMTVSCARCHDHKFDPIPAADYYALAGIFASTDNCAGVRSKMGGSGLEYYDPKMLVPLTSKVDAAPADQVTKAEGAVAAAKKEWEVIRDTAEGQAVGPDGKTKAGLLREKYEQAQIALLAVNDPGTRGFAVHGVRESANISDTAIRIRGEAERMGPVVPRGFLTAISVPDAPAIKPEHSGRLELAQWLTSEKNPLTPRVIVNRIWEHLFTQGIVSTVDNFGINGDHPTHPELLDYLARRFMAQGWSVKSMVRELALSRTYRLGSESTAQLREADPTNKMLWRHSPRRLDAEEIRDAILLTSGQLQPKPADGSPARVLKMIEMNDNGDEARAITQAADQARYRSVYLPLLRGVTPKSLEVFDPVGQTLVTGQRESTTVPTQALYLLNSSFVRKQSLALADRLVAEHESDAKRIRDAYQLTLNRPPTREEEARASGFIRQYEALFQTAPAPKNDPVPVIDASFSKKRDLVAQQSDEERLGHVFVDEKVEPAGAKDAAWMSFIQALYGSAEFRFVR